MIYDSLFFEALNKSYLKIIIALNFRKECYCCGKILVFFKKN